MADLQSMFTDLGPATASYNLGQQATQDRAAAEMQNQLRSAQAQEVMQRIAQQEQMNPLELQAKQQAIQGTQFTQKQKELAAHKDLLSGLIPTLENAPPAARHALLEQMSSAKGLPLDEADKKHLYSLNGDQLLNELKKQHEWSITQDPAYRKQQMQSQFQKESHIEGANIQSKERLQAAREQIAAQRELEQIRIGAGKYAKKNAAVTDIETAVKTGKMTPDKAATSFYAAAQFADNDEDRTKYTQMAQAYEQLAMNLKNAGAQGKPDVGAMTNLPTQKIPSALGGAPRGSATNPIKLD